MSAEGALDLLQTSAAEIEEESEVNFGFMVSVKFKNYLLYLANIMFISEIS